MPMKANQPHCASSRLYSEKAYVLSRGFVRRALEIPPGGLEAEVDWLYHKKGKLQKVVQDARTLIEISKTSAASKEERQDRAVARLTEGGIIALNRTLSRLTALADEPKSE
jgi:ubiquitin-conjugating enzyme E2 O